jgi:DNA-binding LacI/PurR family transcriptional regulator
MAILLPMERASTPGSPAKGRRSKMGHMAFESLPRLISVRQAAESIQVRAELIVRESTAAPRPDRSQ